MSVSRLKALRVSAEATMRDAKTMSIAIVFVNLKIVGFDHFRDGHDALFPEDSRI
ncbi:hypothetical protein [Bradyrhizobium sp. LTSP857]|uniref:hypothetical protein n=1 Tax=Bradyrhizobium sp. LTSP857 TaxID=1619231 RepID=UPI000B20FE20|nr:hypothetical protein [Bradyrhizobium sp. LTSP857]